MDDDCLDLLDAAFLAGQISGESMELAYLLLQQRTDRIGRYNDDPDYSDSVM